VESTKNCLNNGKEIFSNKVLLISCLVMFFIPILYAGFFLKANWDPYGSTDELSIAVVNEDQSVDYEGKKLAYPAWINREFTKKQWFFRCILVAPSKLKRIKNPKY